MLRDESTTCAFEGKAAFLRRSVKTAMIPCSAAIRKTSAESDKAYRLKTV